jgi:hypothetical protein
VGFRFLDSPFSGNVVSPAPNRALNLAGTAGARQDPSNDIARRSQQISGCTGTARLKSGHVPVSAFVAIEFELIPAIGREVLMIGGEIDNPHSARMLLVCKSKLPLPEEKRR